MKVKDLMTENPVCCTPDDTIERAASLMERNDCGCLPVVDGSDSHRVIGVVTDRDITVRATGHGRSPDTRVSAVMTDRLCCCSADSDVSDVERLMADNQVRRIVVVDNDGCCRGIVAQADLARAAEHSAEVRDEEVGRVVERISEPARGS